MDCRWPLAWSTVTANHVMRGKPPEPGADLNENPEAITLAQWASSSWQPYSTFDLAAQDWFHRLGVLVIITPMLRRSPSMTASVWASP